MINEPSDKQLVSIRESNSRINIWEGAVRSGKSFASLIRWIKFIRQGPPGDLIMCGRTDKTIKRNLINPLTDLIGADLSYQSGKGEVNIWGRTIYIVGANDDRAEAKIRGSTFAGALIDEVTLMPENFFKMLLSRLSVSGAKLFGTTNTDSPFHWLKTEFLDNKDLDLESFQFNIEDNPSLTKEYVDNLKKEYQGLWYQRFIDGKWVLAEGAVYDFFDEKFHVIDHKPGNATEYIVGVDYGTTNPCVFVLIGYNPSLYPNMWLEKEYYYDSRKTNRQKTDSQYAKDLADFIDGIGIKTIYVDPSAASFKVECMRIGLTGLVDANNDVVDGIRFMSQLISNGTYKICGACPNSIQEFGTYLWDPKAAMRGEDKPIKSNDHSMDAQRYALATRFFRGMSDRMTEGQAKEMERLYARNY